MSTDDCKQCNKCDFVGATNTALKNHMKLHIPEKVKQSPLLNGKRGMYLYLFPILRILFVPLTPRFFFERPLSTTFKKESFTQKTAESHGCFPRCPQLHLLQ